MRAITIDADTGKRVYTRKEVADLVGASTQSIRLWEDAGAIPASVRDEGGSGGYKGLCLITEKSKT